MRSTMPSPSNSNALVSASFRKHDKYTDESMRFKNMGLFPVCEDEQVAKSAPVEEKEKGLFSSSASVHSDQITNDSPADTPMPPQWIDPFHYGAPTQFKNQTSVTAQMHLKMAQKRDIKKGMMNITNDLREENQRSAKKTPAPVALFAGQKRDAPLFTGQKREFRQPMLKRRRNSSSLK